MRLTDAIEQILEQVEQCEATRIVAGHLRHLRKKEEGTDDSYRSVKGKVHAYVEYHHDVKGDVGVAYNKDRVWVCIDGKSLFRAKAEGNNLISEYHPREGQYQWQNALKFASHKEGVKVSKRMQKEYARMKKELEELRNEALSGD